MKILFTNTGPWGTGSFTALDSIYEELTQRGHEVRIFFPKPPGMAHGPDDQDRPLHAYRHWDFPIQSGNISVNTFPLIIPGAHPHNSEAHHTYKSLSDAQLDLLLTDLRKNLQAVIDDFQPDIIECNHIWAMSYLVSQLGHSYIAVAHNSDQMAFTYDERMRPYALEAAKNADSIISITEKNKEDVISLYSVDPKKVNTIKNSYNAKIFQPCDVSRKELLKSLDFNIPDDATIINLTGKLTRIKGVDILLEANRLLPAERNIHIIVVGTGALDDLIDPEDAGKYCFDRVHFTGQIAPSVVAKIHNISKFSVVPSRSEGFPISCIEAMGCGLPVIITELGGSEKITSGRIIPQEDPQALTNAIMELQDMPFVEFQTLSTQALNRVEQFTWKTNVDNRLALYERLLQPSTT